MTPVDIEDYSAEMEAFREFLEARGLSFRAGVLRAVRACRIAMGEDAPRVTARQAEAGREAGPEVHAGEEGPTRPERKRRRHSRAKAVTQVMADGDDRVPRYWGSLREAVEELTAMLPDARAKLDARYQWTRAEMNRNRDGSAVVPGTPVRVRWVEPPKAEEAA
jgi:hypothetical protein